MQLLTLAPTGAASSPQPHWRCRHVKTERVITDGCVTGALVLLPWLKSPNALFSPPSVLLTILTSMGVVKKGGGIVKRARKQRLLCYLTQAVS